MKINYIDIGNRIKERRVQMNIIQEKLAETAELSVQHLSGIENGKTKFSFGSIVRIANALEMSMDELLCGSLVRGKEIMQNDLAELLADCTPKQTAVMIDTVKALKKSLKQNENSGED